MALRLAFRDRALLFALSSFELFRSPCLGPLAFDARFVGSDRCIDEAGQLASVHLQTFAISFQPKELKQSLCAVSVVKTVLQSRFARARGAPRREADGVPLRCFRARSAPA